MDASSAHTSSELHQKIQLVADDIRFLKKQFQDGARAKLDLHLPVQDSEDPLRQKVQDQIEEFIVEVFEMAKHAMVIDGEDTADKDLKTILSRDDAVEPFDLALNDKLRKVYADVDELTLEVMELRRTVPSIAASHFQSFDIEVDENVISANDETQYPSAPEPPVKDFEDIITLTKELKKSVPDEFVELEKLQETINYFTPP